jgi:hypothetical protein
MFDLFKKKESTNPQVATTSDTARYNTAPGTQIHYSPDLIDSLISDHRAMLEIYGEIKSAFDATNMSWFR